MVSYAELWGARAWQALSFVNIRIPRNTQSLGRVLRVSANKAQFSLAREVATASGACEGCAAMLHANVSLQQS